MTSTKLERGRKCPLSISVKISYLILSTIVVLGSLTCSQVSCQIGTENVAMDVVGVHNGYCVENLEYVCGVIVAEAGYDYQNQCLVAQCILNGAIDNDTTLYQTTLVGYTYPSSDWTAGLKALNDVLNGYRVVNEPIKYFYNPTMCSSSWHESQELVIEYGGHRYFKEVV